jgi:DNA polymerase-4
MGIFRAYTPLVEPLSLDEAFLDVAGCERLFGDAVAIGREIKARILRETPLPVSKVFGVGPRTAKRLEGLGVATIGDLARRERAEVLREFGATGAWIHDLAHGIDRRRVVARREEKSHGMERTFPEDLSEREELRAQLLAFCEEVSFGLRDRGLRGRTVTLKARFADFRTVTRTRTLEHPTNLGSRLYHVALELFERVERGPLRLLGIQVSNLCDVRLPAQAELFEAPLLKSGTRAAAPTRKLERAAGGARGRGPRPPAAQVGAGRGRAGHARRPALARGARRQRRADARRPRRLISARRRGSS